ncbi:MAG: right-handed parallel beta-helix repeat-containing protein [Acidobacteria bacterium]|uniref:Right-handed parallel beta-helix repeat-containing protein n=1 Tax=Candidatus Polarisedimenticola svalbardensis TaxID=2886004 RepID=A0A8J7CDE4_9BACT|nr:right-handed parallel beta-helix repeat-containing protein [Candidatus Polarisedimenticola svalbardensis]
MTFRKRVGEVVTFSLVVLVTLSFSTVVCATTTGTVQFDETWVGEVVLTGDVTVPDGVTLTIAAGTIVKAAPLSDDQASGLDTARIELIIEGTLNLEGTPSLPVTFTSNQRRPQVPTAGDWYGIRMTNTADSTITIHDLIIEAGVAGFSANAGSHQDIVNCTVRDMTSKGIYMEFGEEPRDGADPGILISGNTLEGTGPSFPGIYLKLSSNADPSWDDATHQIVGNVIRDGAYQGIDVSVPDFERLEIVDNTVSNTFTGIYVFSNYNTSSNNQLTIRDNSITGAPYIAINIGGGRSVLVENNTVTGGTDGIELTNALAPRIVDNTLDGGTDFGITILGLGSLTETHVHRNLISGYGSGIRFRGRTSLVALYNTITGTERSIELTGGTPMGVPRFHWNNIQDSTIYAAYNDSSASVDMKHNYWGTTNVEMQAEGYPSDITTIFDIEDWAGKGRVDYRGVENLLIDTAITLESRFVWPFNGDLLSRQTISLEGTAYAEAGVQLVELSTDGGSNWLPASGTDFWNFQFTPTLDGLHQFLSRVTDNDGIVEATPDVITVDFDSTLPTTEGTLPDNETWSGTIILTGDVLIPQGRTLTIDPGTTILMQPTADNTHSGIDTSRIELIVEGDLIAEGSGPGSIQMTSGSVTPGKGHWYGIRYSGENRALTDLRGLTVEWGAWGLSGTSIPSLDQVVVRGMRTYGIHADQAPLGAGTWTFRDLEINDVDRDGARLTTGSEDTNILMERVTIRNTTYDSMDLFMDTTETVTLRDSTFESLTNEDAVFIQQPGSVTLERVSIHNDTSSGYGVRVYGTMGTGVINIRDSAITGGSWPVDIYGAYTVSIRDNWISGGSSGGVNLRGSGFGYFTAALTGNHISDSPSDGLFIHEYVDVTMHQNNLTNTGGYALNNVSTNPVDAVDNYWGVTATAEMDAEGCVSNIETIFDFHDDPAKGLVTYCGYATEPFGDTSALYFHKSGGQYELHWNAKGSLTYDLIRGDVANLALGVGIIDLGAVTCEEQANGTGIIVDSSTPPALGQTWFYLLRDHSTPGDYGQSTGGLERIPSSGDCP